MSKEQNIKLMSEFEHIRHRPGVYVGETDTTEVLCRELIDNSLDECLNGYSDFLEIETGSDDLGDFIKVTDHGRGLPQSEMDDGSGNQVITAKLLFIKLFSGGKFDNENYKVSAGLNGMGLTVVNALSDHLIMWTGNGKTEYQLEFSKGEQINEQFVDIETLTSYTIVKMYPSPDIFDSAKAKIDIQSLQVAKIQLKNSEVIVNGETIEPLSYVDLYKDECLFPNFTNFEFEYDHDIDGPKGEEHAYRSGLRVHMLFSWAKSEFDARTSGTVNLISCNNGVHIKYAKSIISEIVSEITNKAEKYTSLGLRVHVSVFLPDTAFSSQSKEKLTKSNSLRYSVPDITKKLKKEMKTKVEWAILIEKINKYYASMQKLSKSEFIESKVIRGKGSRPSRNLGLGLYECTAKDRSGTELFLVEGNSAAGGLVRTRSTHKHAILPLRGKTLNVASSQDIERILNNKEIRAMVNAVGVGISPSEDLDAIRYEKIIISADADPDGKNIAGLILGAFCYLTPKLVASGHLYLMKAPLYKQGKKYLFSDDELDRSKAFTRFKGLGEMNPEELKTIAFDDSRVLEQLTIESEEDIDYIINLVGTSKAKKILLTTTGII